MGAISDWQKQMAAARAAAGLPPVRQDSYTPPAPAQPASVAMDVVDAYNAGVQTSPATGTGMAMREAIVSPVSRAMGAIANAASPLTNALSSAGEGVRAFATGAPPAPGPIAAAMPKVAALAPVAPGVAPGVAAAPVAGASVAPATSAMPPSQVPRRNVSIRIAPEEVTPSLAPLPGADPTQQILDLQNNGTWSGMMNAKTLAKRTDADRAAAVAAAGANASLMNANSGHIGAMAQVANAGTNAMKEQTQAGLIGEQIKSAQADLRKKAEFETLTKEMIDPATKPARRKEIEQMLVAAHGKNTANAQVHASPIFDALGQKVGENIYERQGDGSWKSVTPKPSLRENPQAMAVVNDPKMANGEKRAKLQAMGYQ